MKQPFDNFLRSTHTKLLSGKALFVLSQEAEEAQDLHSATKFFLGVPQNSQQSKKAL